MNTSLSVMTKASQLLAEANTIQKAKELKDLALTAQDWARHKGLGEQAIQHCRQYALEAERKMGEMLRATPRATGAKGIGKSAVTTGNCTPPTLDEIGITKRESVKAQRLAVLPQEKFQEVLTGKPISSVIDPKTPPPPPPTTQKDGIGNDIPARLMSLWLRGHEIQDMLTDVTRMKAVIEDAKAKKDQLFSELNFDNTSATLKTLYAELKATKPFCICPFCKGDGCRACDQRGMIGKFRYDTSVPQEMK
jgi:hypothetical protein